MLGVNHNFVITRGEELPKPTRGRGRNHHVPVMVAIERSTGKARTRVVADVTAVNLREALAEMVSPDATIHTDEHVGYKAVAKGFAGHETVNHSEKEYARGDVTTNRAEGFFARLERSVMGIPAAPAPLGDAHMEFLHNTRGTTDGERVRQAIQMADGKRLTRKAPTDQVARHALGHLNG